MEVAKVKAKPATPWWTSKCCERFGSSLHRVLLAVGEATDLCFQPYPLPYFQPYPDACIQHFLWVKSRLQTPISPPHQPGEDNPAAGGDH